MYGPAATNRSGGSGASGPTALYRYDRNGAVLHLVDRDLGAARADVHFTAAVSDDGDWIAYLSTRREPAIVPDFVADGSLLLYAHQVSAGRTILVDSAAVPGPGEVSMVAPMAVIDANLLLYNRNLPAAPTIDYFWQPLRFPTAPGGQPFPERKGLGRSSEPVAPPARMSPRCLRWSDGSSWCVPRL
jgi:hypothetical protein